jgi:hypothetical protein
MQLIITTNTNYIDIMKFTFFRKKYNVECIKCGKIFKNEIELTDHNSYCTSDLNSFFA